MAKLKRMDVLLTEDTQEKLRAIAKEVGYTTTASDLIRYALYKVYGVEFSSAHIWISRVEERLPEILGKQKSKGGS